jgi:hypothetical protein
MDHQDQLVLVLMNPRKHTVYSSRPVPERVTEIETLGLYTTLEELKWSSNFKLVLQRGSATVSR